MEVGDVSLNGARGSRPAKRELRAIKRYFTPFPRSSLFLWVVALGLIAVGVSGDAGLLPDDVSQEDSQLLAVVGGLLVVAIGVVRIASWMRKPSGGQMDRWLDRDLTRLKNRAREKCGLTGMTLTSETVLLTGPRFGVAGADFAYRSTRREFTRFTPVGVTILNFTEHEIFAYQCALDRFTGNAMGENTDEYFYRDVVSVSTQTENLVLDKRDLTRTGRKLLKPQIRGGRLQIPSAEMFTLTTSGGTTIEVVIEVVLDKLNRLVMGPGGAVEVNIADRAIAAMRQMLREKKIPPKADRDEDLPPMF